MDPETRTLRHKTNLVFYELFLHKKTNIIQNMTENIISFINFIFNCRAVVKHDHFIT
jgi:hypothetical protein